MRRTIVFSGVIVLVLALAAPTSRAQGIPVITSFSPTVVSCPFQGWGGDWSTRGFYVSGYQGTNIDTVTLRYVTHTPGTYSISLSARIGSYDGPLIGTSDVTVSLPLSGVPADVTFQFGGLPVSQGSTVTFAQSASGPVFFDVGNGPLGDPSFSDCPGVVETEGTLPPLDTFRRASVGLIITQRPSLSVPIDVKPGSTTNPIKLSSMGKIPVAIVSTASFDAITVDPTSVCFGDAEAPSQRNCTATHSSLVDVNADERLDLLLHFGTQHAGIDPGDAQACLTGTAAAASTVEGCDSIRTL